MQPKPIDFRRLLDIDSQRRTVEMEGFAEHLRGVREHKEHPAETDYDVAHDEQSRRDGEEASRQSAEKLKQAHAEDETDKGELPEKDAAKTAKEHPNGQKGSRLDIEA